MLDEKHSQGCKSREWIQTSKAVEKRLLRCLSADSSGSSSSLSSFNHEDRNGKDLGPSEGLPVRNAVIKNSQSREFKQVAPIHLVSFCSEAYTLAELHCVRSSR